MKILNCSLAFFLQLFWVSFNLFAACLIEEEGSRYGCERLQAADSYCAGLSLVDLTRKYVAYKTTTSGFCSEEYAAIRKAIHQNMALDSHTDENQLVRNVATELSFLSQNPVALPVNGAISYCAGVLVAEANQELASQCSNFSAEDEPIINEILSPNKVFSGGKMVFKEMHETSDTIKKMHQLISSTANTQQINSRIIYGLMLGESRANPFALNGQGSGAYGMFQFLGSFFDVPTTEFHRFDSNIVTAATKLKVRLGRVPIHKEIIEELSRLNPNKSLRLIQIEYYTNYYIPYLAFAADKGYGCNRRKKFAEYTQAEKWAYISNGGCDLTTRNVFKSIMHTNLSYKPLLTFTKEAFKTENSVDCE